MGLGILEDHKLDHVPGTATVLEGEHRRKVELDAAQKTHLKYDETGTILLVPQPSDDPNDPLNWPLWKRDVILFILSLTSIICTTLSPILAANTVSLATRFRRNFTDMALLTGYHVLGVGVAGFLFVPSARIWGKRHAYLLGTFIVVISCIWAGATGTHYGSFLWARIFQGVGLAPFEALVNASVGDLYHVHQRGTRMALSNFCVFGSAFFTPVIVGVMSYNIGYEWTFYFVAIFAGLMLPLLFFFVPETAYRREEQFDIDTMGNLVMKTDIEMKKGGEVRSLLTSKDGPARGSDSTSGEVSRDGPPSFDNTSPHANETSSAAQEGHTSTRTVPRKATFVESLALFNGRKSDEPYLHLLFRPFPLFFHPGMLWACLIQGTLIGFTVLIGVVLGAIMLGPPLWFNEVKAGYMYAGAFIGALIGFAISGLISDWSAKVLTRWNGGVYEPEFRMVLVIPQLVFGCTGLYGFGWTSANAAYYGWFWPDFFFSLVIIGMVCGAVASALYIVDAHRDMSIEGFTCLLVFKNMFSFALTFKGFDWMIGSGRSGGGVKTTFIALGSVQVAICALTIPMYILGKKNRSFFYRHNIFFGISDAVADTLSFWRKRK